MSPRLFQGDGECYVSFTLDSLSCVRSHKSCVMNIEHLSRTHYSPWIFYPKRLVVSPHSLYKLNTIIWKRRSVLENFVIKFNLSTKSYYFWPKYYEANSHDLNIEEQSSVVSKISFLIDIPPI